MAVYEARLWIGHSQRRIESKALLRPLLWFHSSRITFGTGKRRLRGRKTPILSKARISRTSRGEEKELSWKKSLLRQRPANMAERHLV